MESAILINLARLPRPVLALGVPLLFFAIALWTMPIAEVLQFDPDEGIELAKATLYSQGYQLYEPIWNDQPPLLTLLLASWLKLFGSQIVAARLLILGFATVLVGAFFNTLMLIVGLWPALLGTIGLCLTLDFLRLSVSVMQGLPAIALAMLAIYFLIWISQDLLHNSCPPHPFLIAQRLYPSPIKGEGLIPSPLSLYGRGAGGEGDISASGLQTSASGWQYLPLIASGVCFGLSLQIKLYTALLLPACFLHLALGASFQDWQHFKIGRLRLSLIWLVSCAVTVLMIAYPTHSLSITQVLGTHFDGAAQVSLQREPSWQLLLMFLAQDLDYTLLAGVGIFLLIKQKSPLPVLPLVWLITVWVALTYYQPLWYHYYPLISVPVVWLASYGLIPAFKFFRQKQWVKTLSWQNFKRPTISGVAAGFVMFAIALTPVKLAVNVFINHQFVAESKPKLEVIEKVQALQSSTQWLFTDLPIVAFYTGLKVPPELAVFSTKRIASGSLSDAKLAQILQTYQPKQVLLGRYPKVEAALTPYLSQHYRKQYEKDKVTQYVRKTVN